MTQQEISLLYGNSYSNIDFIINTPTQFLTFKLAFKIPSIDLITEDETLQFINTTQKLSKTLDIKCSGYFIGNVKLSDKAYDILKKTKHFYFCCDADQTKLNQKIIKMLYANQLYIFDDSGDCIMIDA